MLTISNMWCILATLLEHCAIVRWIRRVKYKLILWDFDGTLADTLHAALDIYNQLAMERGYRTIENPHVVRDMGMRKFLTTHGVPIYRVPTLFATFLRELRKQAASINLNDGIANVVGSLADAGVAQCVVSSNDTETIRECLAKHGINDRFHNICGTSRIFGKESGIRSAIESACVRTVEALYVGDEIRDIEAANAAGVDIATVGWGLNSRRALLKHSPAHFVNEPTELLDLATRKPVAGQAGVPKAPMP